MHERPIELGLDRVREVATRLDLTPPTGRVFTVAGTNGKGSCVQLLDAFLHRQGCTTGVYTSPHLVRYNERVQLSGEPADDATLVAAFRAVEDARADVPLTYFEFGTLAALWLFSRHGCAAWVLEVGMGGR
ncbi:MAG: hypothetical protein MI702_12050, partial [Chlorobiales bacterium]|nr:hypothetical protein [Chlorobiales bacterium]